MQGNTRQQQDKTQQCKGIHEKSNQAKTKQSNTNAIAITIDSKRNTMQDNTSQTQ